MITQGREPTSSKRQSRRNMNIDCPIPGEGYSVNWRRAFEKVFEDLNIKKDVKQMFVKYSGCEVRYLCELARNSKVK